MLNKVVHTAVLKKLITPTKQLMAILAQELVQQKVKVKIGELKSQMTHMLVLKVIHPKLEQ